MTDTISYVHCPVCGLNRTLNRAKVATLPNPQKHDLVQFRRQYGREKGGKCKGFPRVGGLTIKQAAAQPEYRHYLSRILKQARLVIQELEEAGVR